MRRRQMLANTGAVLLGTGVFATVTTASEGSRRLPPNENTPSTMVRPFGSLDQEVATGDWIQHRLGWVAETKELIEDTVDSITVEAWIDGEYVDDFDSYRGDIIEEDGDWFTFWRYTTPPKSPGEYEFRIRVEFIDQPISEDWEKGDVVNSAGTYTVVPDGGRN